MRFGFNDLGGDLTPLLTAYRPAAWVTFDGGRARWLKDTFPEAFVIYRHMPDGDNLFKRAPDALAWYSEARRACEHDNRIIIQAGNEPDGDKPALASWTCAVIDAAEADGGTVGVLAFATCHPATTDWRGPLLPVLRKLAGSRHYLLAHEYFVQAGASGDWCIGCFRDALKACDLERLPRPKVIISEFGFDLPGWKVQQRTDGLLDETYAAVLVRAWNNVYAPEGVKAACIFAWGKGDRWQDYDVSDAGAFLTALKNAQMLEPVPLPSPPAAQLPEPEPEPEPGQPPKPSEDLAEAVARLLIRVRWLERTNQELAALLREMASVLEQQP